MPQEEPQTIKTDAEQHETRCKRLRQAEKQVANAKAALEKAQGSGSKKNPSKKQVQIEQDAMRALIESELALTALTEGCDTTSIADREPEPEPELELEQQPDQQPDHEPDPDLMDVECPEGCQRGDPLFVPAPNGREVVVPDGVYPGDEFQVSVSPDEELPADELAKMEVKLADTEELTAAQIGAQRAEAVRLEEEVKLQAEPEPPPLRTTSAKPAKPLDAGCFPLSYSGNPVVNWRILQGGYDILNGLTLSI